LAKRVTQREQTCLSYTVADLPNAPFFDLTASSPKPSLPVAKAPESR
jgi:hypothetical protein